MGQEASGIRGLAPRRRPFLIQREQALEDLIVRPVGGPAIGCGDRLIQPLMGHVQPSRALVVQIGQGAGLRDLLPCAKTIGNRKVDRCSFQICAPVPGLFLPSHIRPHRMSGALPKCLIE